ncbi:hypothetical protein BDR03DRAFT_959968 [Suillus americanus]|nr:hypothetical protein BDR03DRAFT_959968 [Suillus americanus]
MKKAAGKPRSEELKDLLACLLPCRNSTCGIRRHRYKFHTLLNCGAGDATTPCCRGVNWALPDRKDRMSDVPFTSLVSVCTLVASKEHLKTSRYRHNIWHLPPALSPPPLV